MKTRQIRKQRILEVAFEEWGKKNFASTSLSLLTRRLRLSKPALYRYFPNKLGLIQALENEFIETYAAMHEEFLAAQTSGCLETFAGDFIDRHYRFFSRHPYFYNFFLLHMMRQPLTFRQKLAPFSARLERQLAVHLRENGRDYQDGELPSAIRFLYANAIFWLSSAFLCGRQPGSDEIEASLAFARAACLGGVLRRNEARPDHERIEKQAVVCQDEMLPPDRLFSAVEAAVAEVGLAEASIDRIAAKVGMSKSSLYFYFQNKDDMLGRTIAREQDHIAGLMTLKVLPQTTFSERSYAYMVMLATYTLNNPSLITVFNWLRFQNIGHSMNPPARDFSLRFFSFFLEAAEAGQVTVPGDDTLRAASFLHVLAFREVMDQLDRTVHPAASMPRADLYPRLRTLHRFYLHGLYPLEVKE